MTRLKRAERERAEADAAVQAAFNAMGAAEVAWAEAKLDTGSWFESQQRADTRRACLRDLRRARNAFRKNLKELITLQWAVDRLTEDRERRQEVARYTRQRKQRSATVAEIAAGAGADFTRVSA